MSNVVRLTDQVHPAHSICHDKAAIGCAGANAVDRHFHEAPFESNIPVLLGLASVWNVSFLNYPARAILPYCQALSKLAPHIQQVCTVVCRCIGG